MADNRRSFHQAAQVFAPGPSLHRVLDHTLRTPSGALPTRIYRSGPATAPGLLYLHGGGWALGDLDTHDSICRSLAHDARCTVIAVDYRRPPEHRFPAALEDAIAAVHGVLAVAPELRIDGHRLAIGGDSAGGNLAAATVQALRDERLLVHQLLFIPALDARIGRWPSYEEFASGTPLTRGDMEWYYEHYVGDLEALSADPRLSPLTVPDLRGLPPATIITAECDPLRDEGEAYAARLECANVPVSLRRYDGMFHPFVLYGSRLSAARAAQRFAAARLQHAFA